MPFLGGALDDNELFGSLAPSAAAIARSHHTNKKKRHATNSNKSNKRTYSPGSDNDEVNATSAIRHVHPTQRRSTLVDDRDVPSANQLLQSARKESAKKAWVSEIARESARGAHNSLQRVVEASLGRKEPSHSNALDDNDGRRLNFGKLNTDANRYSASSGFEHPPRRARSSLQASTTLRELLGAPTVPFEMSKENNAALIIIDAQNTYTSGVMELVDVVPAMEECKALLNMARNAGVPVIHVQHDCGKGSPYDVTAESGAIVPMLTPKNVVPVGPRISAANNSTAAASMDSKKSKKNAGAVAGAAAALKKKPSFKAAAASLASEEFVIIKKQTSSFVNTGLEPLLKALDIKNLVICGFMAHCCVESTTRDAAHKGFNNVVVSAACATRNLPDPAYFNSTKFSTARAEDGAVCSAEELKRAAMTALGDAFALIVPEARDIPVPVKMPPTAE